MSHDIRTPLNAIIGFAKLAMKSEGNFEQIQDYLSKISVSGNHLLAIVNDVLEVSRIESGQTKLEDSDLANILIIALSANAFEEDRKVSTDAGMNGHLAKPVNVSELLKMLCKLF